MPSSKDIIVDLACLPMFPFQWNLQRLDFLGDALLDYLITKHLHTDPPNLSSRLLTDLRSDSVNNDCYARAAIKAGLHQHILLHDAQHLKPRILAIVKNFKQSSQYSNAGWESGPVIKVILHL